MISTRWCATDRCAGTAGGGLNPGNPMQEHLFGNQEVAAAASAARVEIYADGACRGNPGPGGWGVLLRQGATERELFGGEPATTNNRMELRAVIEGLRALGEPSVVKVMTDSQYVQKGISEWIRGWKARGWLTADRKPVKNAELWRALEAAAAPHQVEWIWVKGHAGVEGNERADRLANRGIDAR
jgi:ribonuclease HI